MTVKEFSEKISRFNEDLDKTLTLIKNEAPLLNTSAMIVEHNRLEAESQRNNLGLIRAIFLGESNSGKSTMINALAGKIIVPEVAHTSTMIPTWIGYTDDIQNQGVEVDYYPISTDREGNEKIDSSLKIKNESIDKFRCFYCFPPEAAADPERLYTPQRFKSMKLNEAYMRILAKDGLMSRFSMTLVDTLGNGATLKDDLKAQHNMQDVDMAFVLLNENGTINEGTRDFLANTLFKSAVRPEHIVFIINKIDRASSPIGSIRNCKQSIKSILNVAYGDNIPSGLEERLFSQIAPYSALYNRIVTAGPYPFIDDTKKINDISDAEYENPKDDHQCEIVEIAKEQTRFESKLSKNKEKEEQEFIEVSHYGELENVLTSVVKNMFSDGTIVENHLDKIEKLVRRIITCVNDRLIAFDQDVDQISGKIKRFTDVSKRLTKENGKFNRDERDIINSFPNEINAFLKNNAEKIINTLGAKGNGIVESINISARVRNRFRKAEEIRDLSSAEIQQLFVPEYNVYKERLVAVLCDEISDKIFRSVTDKESATTPYYIFSKKTQQSIKNYITKYMDEIESINDGNKLDIVAVDGALFKKYVDDKMNYLVLRLVDMVQKNTDKIINQGLAIALQKSVHKFGSGWHAWLHNDDVNYFFNKMNEAAKESIIVAVLQVVDIMKSDEGFIKSNFSDQIKDTLKEIIDYTINEMTEYLNYIKVELLQLENSKSDFLSRKDYYHKFAEEKVSTPLRTMLEEVEQVKNIALNEINFSANNG